MQNIRKGNVQKNLNERKRIGGCVAQKMGGEGGGVGLVHDQPGEGTIEYWTRSCPFHKGLGKGVGNEKKNQPDKRPIKKF